MSLPKPQINFFADKKHIEALLFPVGVGVILVFVLIIGFILPKQKQNNNKTRVNPMTQSSEVTTAEGKTQAVPPAVMQITPVQLKAMIAGKEKITIVQVVSGEGWNYPHIAGAQIIPLKHFDTSTNNLSSNDTNIFISNDGYDSAVAISKLLNSAFPREKNFNLEGGLDAWKAKGYSVEQ